MKKIIFFAALILAMSASVHAQRIWAGTNIPLFYTLGYQQSIGERFSANAQFGLLTTPYDKAVLEILEAFDTDEALTNTIGEAFTIGVNVQPTFRWYFRKSYLGLAYSYLSLRADECPADAIENYYGISIPALYSREYTLQSELHSAGLLYGRVFTLKNPRCAIHLELSALKTFASKSEFKDDGILPALLNEPVDKELNETYVKYGMLPSINVFFVYNLKSDL